MVAFLFSYQIKMTVKVIQNTSKILNKNKTFPNPSIYFWFCFVIFFGGVQKYNSLSFEDKSLEESTKVIDQSC